MSELLQQAIVDATALKEAAIKNAENTLIEKYSQEFKETVQKLLEQEVAAAPDTSSTTTPTPDAALTAAPADAEAAIDPSALDPMAGGLNATGDIGKKDAFSKVPGVFSDTSDDEMITINFDQIRATLNEMLGYETNQDPTSDATAQGKAPINVTEEGWAQEEVEEELKTTAPVKVKVVGVKTDEEQTEELELEEADLSSPEVVKATQSVAQKQGELAQKQKELGDKQVEDAKRKAADAQKAASAVQPASTMEEEIELTEQELQELAEELKVDLKVGNLSDGYLGSTETQKREQRNVELAAARDEAAAKEREIEVQKMKDLMQENIKVKDLNGELLKAVETLKEQMEAINLSNAKLLYTNKALGNISLNERQKQNIVESISKADSVLAAKTIYETLQNAVDTVTKEKEAPQSLREALNRAPSPFVVKKSSANSINDLMAERMKALAGIKNQ
jgi:hypothetical protein